MPTKVWYEPVRELYAVEFIDDPVFDLPEWAIGKEQLWGAISYHLFAAFVEKKFLFHRLAIERQHLPEETLRDDLIRKLTWLVNELRYIGRPPVEHSPTGWVSRPCIRAAEILEVEQGSIVEKLLIAEKVAT